MVLTEEEEEVRVALIGLAPVYMHGLQIGLTLAGVACTVHRGVDELPALLEQAGSVVAVLPQSAVAALSTLQLEPENALTTVHVLADDTVRAHSSALGAGATGAFPANAELDRVVRTVRAAALGDTLMPRQIARALGRPQVGTPPHLEPQQRTYLRLLASGVTVAMLARRSGYSEREMYRLLSGIYGRLGAHNRTEALLVAERWGLLDQDPAGADHRLP